MGKNPPYFHYNRFDLNQIVTRLRFTGSRLSVKLYIFKDEINKQIYYRPNLWSEHATVDFP